MKHYLWPLVVFFSVCMLAGVLMAWVLISNGMNVQDAFNSGMGFASLPAIIVGGMALVAGFLD